MQYIVKNPRGIPKGVVILSWQPKDRPQDHKDWYEGDGFTPPAKMLKSSVQGWIDSGLIEEA